MPLEEDNNVQIEKLSEIITNIDYIEFLDVQQSYKNEDKSQKQAVVTLYLTILYILTKNLVNVNSRYVIALHCLERDSTLYGIKLKKEKISHLNTISLHNTLLITDILIERKKIEKMASM